MSKPVVSFSLRKITIDLISKDPEFPVEPIVQYWIDLDNCSYPKEQKIPIMIGKKQFQEIQSRFKFVPDLATYDTEKKASTQTFKT